MTDLVLRNANLWGHGPADLRLSGGRIAEIGPAASAEGGADGGGNGPESGANAGGIGADGADTEDLGGAVVIPGLVDAHAHLDKTLWGGPWVPRTAGPGLDGAIAYGMERREELGIPSTDYITALLEHMVASGTTHARSHVDVDPGVGLDGVIAVREAVARLGGRIEVEIVAFPQAGLLTRPGTAELLDAALADGVKLIGGIDPGGYDRDPVRHLDTVFDLAVRHGAGVDIHLHDAGNLGVFEFELIIERTKALGMQGKVTVSHAFALSDPDVPAATRAHLIGELAEQRISLAGSSEKQPLPLRAAAAAGIPAGLGNDGVRDLWSPYGTGDLLAHTADVARGSGFSADPDIEIALRAATFGGAEVIGIEGYGLSVGDRADLVAVDARVPAEALLMHPARRLVVKSGRVVARNGQLV
ncbi:amidohydrolase [Glycomyces buryatensis]|uniref:Cytosine deaminase n=1 Tax=Glycomyces buryatensis TaxID=2570927 RepID=A0A4S8QDE7_9ACTN|nr:amidohydrolase [Glycomyces buryatensis]THV41641.1 cytosine deaminase [Glycomyces buryatensis]